MQRYTISQFNDDFPDEDTCLGYIAALVYPTFPEMPCRTCGEMFKHHRLNGRKAYSCQKCGTQVYPLAGTITTRMGISAKQLERELGVTYKTAWRMFKQIRALMGDDSGPLVVLRDVPDEQSAKRSFWGVRERLVALAGCDGCCPGVRTAGDGGREALAGMLAPGSGAVGEAERRQVGSGIARSRRGRR